MDKVIEKAATLVEAFPYIRAFRGKVVVVKYGGSAQPEEGSSSTILADLVFMETVGIHPVVVHGGGKEISRRLLGGRHRVYLGERPARDGCRHHERRGRDAFRPREPPNRRGESRPLEEAPEGFRQKRPVSFASPNISR